MTISKVIPIVSIPGYQLIDCIEETSTYSLCRAVRLEDRLLVVMKILKRSPVQTQALKQLRYEAEISQQFQIQGIPRVLTVELMADDSLEFDGNLPIMVMENLVGDSLANLLLTPSNRFAIEPILHFMIATVEILGQLHENGIIHRNLSPHRLFWNPLSHDVQLVNVGMIPLLDFAQDSLSTRDVLPYLSPEQTERLKRSVDYRSDFYSLGIIFYELLTGSCPFISHDPMELIHCHLARQPMPAHEVANVPIGLSAVVLRLLAKTPEERYQSAYGLRYDLKHCLQEWQTHGSISIFALGRVDRASQLNLTRHMYGRDGLLQGLVHQLEQATAGGLQVTLICGEMGIGKSFLVQELQRQVAISSGYFISGKCDDLHPESPNKPLIQALKQLIRQVLTESDDRIIQWRNRINASVGTLAQVLVEVIPELALIVGNGSQPPRLDGVELQNRFLFVLQAFLKVFAQPDAPLVIVLEDLQWSDESLIKGLSGILGDLSSSALYLVGTYRTESRLDQLAITENLQAQFGARAEIVMLELLTLTETTHLIGDVLGTPASSVLDLAAVVFQRSQGNPFFIHQLLIFLQSERLLVFEFEAGKWCWDLANILNRGLTDDVVDLMVKKISRLPQDLQQVLQVAACIGHEFDLELVALLSHHPKTWIAQQLSQAVRDGLILPTESQFRSTEQTFRFLHDKLQQAAYSMMRSDDRQRLHWEVGQIGLKSMLDSRQEEELLFDVVHQLNSGRDRALTQDDRCQLAHLNLGAAQKAKAAAAYELALQYCEIGLALLRLDESNEWVASGAIESDQLDQSQSSLLINPDGPRSSDDSLKFDLLKARAECQYLCGNLAVAEAEFIALSQQAQTQLDRAELCTIQMVLCLTHSQQTEALNLGFQGLMLLGVEFPTIDQTVATQALNRVQGLLHDRGLNDYQSIDSLSALPPLQSEYQLSILRLLQYLAAASVTTNLSLYQMTIVEMVERSLLHGNSVHSAYAYVAYGTILTASLGDYTLGYAFGRAALREMVLRGNSRSGLQSGLQSELQQSSHSRSRFQPLSLVGVTHFSFWGLLAHWHEPLAICRTNLQSAFRACCETGEFLYALYVQVVMGDVALMSGVPLLEVAEQIQQFQDFAHHRQHLILQQDAEIKQRFVRALQGETTQLSDLSATNSSEAQLLQRLKSATNATTTLSRYYIYKLQLLYLSGAYDQAHTIAQASETLVSSHYGTAISVEHYFYQALVLSAQILDQAQPITEVIRSQFDRNLGYLQQWATGCPENFQARLQLLEAEYAAWDSQDSQATTLYDRAIQTAHRFQNRSIEAIASERAAIYHLRQQRPRIAFHALSDACIAYQNWGATRKVQQLRRQLAQFQQKPSMPEILDGSWSSPQQVTLDRKLRPSNLDWMTVLKVSHTLSSEIVFTSLMEKLMQIVIENAGAQRGLLLMHRSDRWQIEAFGRVEQDRIEIHTYLDTATPEHLPFSLLSYVERTHQTIVLDHAAQDSQFGGDSYIRHYGTKSILCFPILSQGKLSSILYLENNLAIGAFTDERLEVLQLLAAQVVISMENARLYSDLQRYLSEVESKNQALKQSQEQLKAQTQQLKEAFERLKDTQTQLVQTEKMSSLGQLVAGVAHEIKNPLNFISGNLDYAKSYVRQLMELIAIYQAGNPNLDTAALQQIEALDLPFLETDLPKLLQSMTIGTDRIENLIRSLQNFSRPSESRPAPSNLHESLDTTLLILQPRLKATQYRPEIQIHKQYGELPLVTCFTSEINQVFMNLIANAIDAIDERCEQFSFDENQSNPDCITLCTGQIENRAYITVQDTGIGMAEEVRSKVFKTFYTTKPLGKGTGLGLSISAQIVVDRHQGLLICKTLDDRGAEFRVELPLIIKDSQMLNNSNAESFD